MSHPYRELELDVLPVRQRIAGQDEPESATVILENLADV